LATTAHTFIIAFDCCVRPNPAASGLRAVQVNQRAALFGECELDYTAAGLRRCWKRYTAFF